MTTYSSTNAKVNKALHILQDYGWTIVEIDERETDYAKHIWILAECRKGGNGLTDTFAQVGFMVKKGQYGGRRTTSFTGGTFTSYLGKDRKVKTHYDLSLWADIMGMRQAERIL